MRYLLKATLKDEEGNPLEGKIVGFFHYTDPNVKTLIGTAETNSDGVAELQYETEQTEYVIAYFAGDETYEASWSNEVLLNPIADLTGKWLTWFNNMMMFILILMLIPTLLSLLKEEKKK